MLEIVGQEHRGHTAVPQLTLNPVAIGQGGLQAIQHIGQASTLRCFERRELDDRYTFNCCALSYLTTAKASEVGPRSPPWSVGHV